MDVHMVECPKFPNGCLLQDPPALAKLWCSFSSHRPLHVIFLFHNSQIISPELEPPCLWAETIYIPLWLQLHGRGMRESNFIFQCRALKPHTWALFSINHFILEVPQFRPYPSVLDFIMDIAFVPGLCSEVPST